jgi:hypothetical protein
MIIPVIDREFHRYITYKYNSIRQPRPGFPTLFFLYHLSDPVLRQRVFKNTDFFIENISHYLTRHLHLNFVLQLFLRVSPLSGAPSAMNMMIKNHSFIDMNHPALARVSQSQAKDFSRALFPQTTTGYNPGLSGFRELSYFSKFFFPPPHIKKVKDWHNGILFHNSPGIMNISPHIPLYHLKDSEVLNRFITKNQGLLKEINIPGKPAHQTQLAPPHSRLTAGNYEAGSMQPTPPHNLMRTTAFYKTLFHHSDIDHMSIFQDFTRKTALSEDRGKLTHQPRPATPHTNVTEDNYETGAIIHPPPPHNLTRTAAFHKTLFHPGAIDHISIFQDFTRKTALSEDRENPAHQPRPGTPRSSVTENNSETGAIPPPPPHNLMRTTAFLKTLFHHTTTGLMSTFQDFTLFHHPLTHYVSIFQDAAGKEIKPAAKSHSLTLALNTTPGKPLHEKREMDFHYLNPLRRTGRPLQSSVKETASSRNHFRDSKSKTASIKQPAGQNLHDTHTISQSPIDIARLTDQVYRMLERKIRVERERRGW